MKLSSCIIPITVLYVMSLLHGSSAVKAASKSAAVTTGFRNSEKKIILDAHNYYRSQRNASNMIKLQWNISLEKIAEEKAKLCQYSGIPLSSPKNHYSMQFVGHLSFISSAIPKKASAVVKAWFEGGMKDNGCLKKIPRPCLQKSLCREHAQIVWARTQYVGCSINHCQQFRKTTDQSSSYGSGWVTVCTYNPSRDVSTINAYSEGSPCMLCDINFPDCDMNLCTRPHTNDFGTDVSRRQKGRSVAGHVSQKAEVVVFTSLMTIVWTWCLW